MESFMTTKESLWIGQEGQNALALTHHHRYMPTTCVLVSQISDQASKSEKFISVNYAILVSGEIDYELNYSTMMNSWLDSS